MSDPTRAIADASNAAMRSAVVAGTFSDPGTVLVEDCKTGTREICDVLVASADGPALLSVGDVVLVWNDGLLDRGVVMGRVGATRAPASRTDRGADHEEPLPEFLVFEASQGLVLRVGNGSIEIRADGKILLKGTDLVSHAKRMNRIKGGAVSIN